MRLTFTVDGKPCAQGRPRFSTAGGFARAYDPPASRDYKAVTRYTAVEEAKRQEWEQGTKAPLRVAINVYLGIPVSKAKKWKTRALRGEERPTVKPDLDNVYKIVTDALSGTLYHDDKQICECVIIKRYADRPRVEVTLETIEATEEGGGE